MSLVLQLIRREIEGRYRGSFLGVLWSLLTPLFLLAVYTFVFGTIFRSRWSVPSGPVLEGSGAFAIVLFAGLIVFQFFSEVVVSAPSLILVNANYVKKIVFPLEILPLVRVGSALFHMCVSLAVLLVFVVALAGSPPVTALLAPLVISPFLLMVLGMAWFLAAAGVYFRDLSQILTPIVTALMFLSPIFFQVSAMPEWLRPWHVLNPLAVPVDGLRDVVIFGRAPDWIALAIYACAAVGIAFLGFEFFQKTRRGFADVL